MAVITHIETIVPDFSYSQLEIGEYMQARAANRQAKKYLAGIYSNSGISKRHSVLDEFKSGQPQKLFSSLEDKNLVSTGKRNNLFAIESGKLINKLAIQTFKNYTKLKASQITHVITVSCTGFYNPGPDLQVIQALGLSVKTERYHLGFMGCYGAFPALKMANQFCEANPKSNVLIICLELCTLHFQMNDNLDSFIANSLFADGAAAVIVSGQAPKDAICLKLESFNSQILFQAEKDMAWTIGDHGFEMVLSKYIPQIIGSNLPKILENILSDIKLTMDQIDRWAIHPGGKSILDKVENSLGLSGDQIGSSRSTLRNYGNMSSASILFVLKDLMEHSKDSDQKIFAMAFGPGLVVESALISLN